jgi:molecular chaperone GrpE (heat shock protein)
VKRKELNPTNRKVVHRKTEGFGKVLWELSLDNIDAKIESLKNSETPPHSNFIEGLSQIISSLDTFLDTTSMEDVSDDFYIKVFDAVHLESGEILRTSEKFQGKEWFSNVAVNPADDQGQYRSDEGAWYGKVSEH